MAPTGLNEVLNQPFAFNVYPNPFTDEANIAFNLAQPENVTLQVTNLLGQIIRFMNVVFWQAVSTPWF